MQNVPETPRRARRWSRKPFLALTLVAGLLAGIVGVANAVPSTITPSQPGQGMGGVDLVRSDQVTVKVAPGAFSYHQPNGTTAFTLQVPRLASGSNSAMCRGDNGAFAAIGSGNESPQTQVVVKKPGGAVLQTTYSPVRNSGLASGLQPYNIASTQPGPSNSNVRMDVPPNNGNAGNAVVNAPGIGFDVPVNLAGQPSGVYTVEITRKSVVRTGSGACAIGAPTPTGGTTGAAQVPVFGSSYTAGLPAAEVVTFEYRPWTYTFDDMLGNGRIQFNILPGGNGESFMRLGTTNGEIIAGGLSAYTFPDAASFSLPEDPEGCAEDPASCLPSTAVACDPALGCVPKVVIIGRWQDSEGLNAVFDMESKAFIAVGRIGNAPHRVLLSLGDNNALYHDTLAKLVALANDNGIDLASILATKVRASFGPGSQQLTVSLLDGLLIDPTTKPFGVQILSDFTAQAGLFVDLYVGANGAPCPSTTGTREASSADDPAPLSWDKSPGVYGYNVTPMPIDLPLIQLTEDLAVGGPLFYLKASGPRPLGFNLWLHALGVDTDEDAPSGLPAWVLPVDGVRTMAPRTFEFIGTGSWSSSETSLGPTACFVQGGFTGIGVGLSNNPLKLGLDGLVRNLNPVLVPLVKPLMAQVNLAVAQLTGEVTANPTIQDLIAQVVEAVLGE